jgi:Protein of unknown function (DUF3153)
MSQDHLDWQDVRVPQARPRRSGLRVLCLTLALLVVGLFASSCVRVHAALAVSSDDRVSGDLVVASLPSAGDAKGPQLATPPEMATRVTTKAYSADGYVGNDVQFKDLSFDEMSVLATAISSENANYHLGFQRSGDLVTLSGSADLSQLPATGVDVQLKVTFPGQITHSDGSLDDDTVSWVMKPGKVNSFNATDQYSLGNSRGWRFWSLVLGGGIALISAFIVLLALWARRRNLKKERAYIAAAAL